MTNQEASKVIKDGIDDMSLDYFDEEQYEALTMAIKALEQEPSGDLISRQAVQDYIAKYLSQYLYDNVREAVEVIDEYIGELPSVNQQEPKTGHWIERGDDRFDWLECSECGYGDEGEVKWGEGTRFCPNCGAKMVESQESEVSE